MGLLMNNPFTKEIFKTLIKNVAGAVFGGIHFVLLLVLISSFVLLLPIPALHETFQSRSLSGPSLAKLGPRIHSVLQPLIPETWRAAAP